MNRDLRLKRLERRFNKQQTPYLAELPEARQLLSSSQRRLLQPVG